MVVLNEDLAATVGETPAERPPERLNMRPFKC